MEIGTRLGPYEIVGPLGAGGMGEVYRARDTKLGRAVAIKVLPEAVSQDAEKLARFGREAHLLASVNHPNIATLYGLEESNGQQFLVMELVEGETLAERLVRGPMPIEDALPLFQHIAEGLETAHEKGIIHRDLKPSNIKMTPEGVPKILDFGLAKALVEEGAIQDNSQSPTLTRDATGTGVLLGTAAYMSPEQARGKPVDKRTDIFSLGIVLYEALAGKRAFPGEDVSDVLASIIKLEPDWEALHSELDSRIYSLLRRCLRKDRRKRLQAIGDVRVEIEDILAEPTDASRHQSAAVSAMGRTRERVAWGLAVIVAVLVGGIVMGPEPPGPKPITRFALTLPPGEIFANPNRHVVALSPDSTRVVYATQQQLYLREMGQLEAVPIRGTDMLPSSPFFSPDGQWVGFYAGGSLRKVSVRGGAPTTLCEAPDPLRASWGDDDMIVFDGDGGILRVSADGGTPEVLIPADPERVEFLYGPQMLPDGETVLFGLWTGNTVEDAQVVTQSLRTGERRVLVEGGSDASYVPTGHLLYRRGDTLLAVPFDLAQLRLTGGPVSVLEGIARGPAREAGVTHASFSDSGALVYVPSFGLATRTLVWVDRDGSERVLTAEPRAYTYPRISPDGSQVALEVRDQEDDMWVWDFRRETLRRLTFTPEIDRYPVWTPDGRRVAFSSRRDGPASLYSKAADGTGTVEPFIESNNLWPYGFSPDGKRLVYFRFDPQGGRDLGFLSLDGDGSLQPLLVTEFNEMNAEISPDGQWLAYQSDASGQFEIYVRPFPNVDEAQWQISTGGGTEPLWARDGSELFYLDPDRRLVAVSVELGRGFDFGNPEVVLEKSSSTFPNARGRTYDVSPDGKRFLIIKETAEARAYEIHVVVNWHEELKRLVPVE